MPVYALATVPFIKEHSSTSDAKQDWYTDDSAAFGKISSIWQWWDTLTNWVPLMATLQMSLTDIVSLQPHAAYAPFTHGLSNL